MVTLESGPSSEHLVWFSALEGAAAGDSLAGEVVRCPGLSRNWLPGDASNIRAEAAPGRLLLRVRTMGELWNGVIFSLGL